MLLAFEIMGYPIRKSTSFHSLPDIYIYIMLEWICFRTLQNMYTDSLGKNENETQNDLTN